MAEKKETKTPESNKRVGKNQFVIIGALVLLCIIAVIAIVAINNSNSDEATNNTELTEEEISNLSYAEELALYTHAEDATQDDKDLDNLALAVAFYREGDYETSLSYAEKIENPSEQNKTALESLYASLLPELGRTEEGLEYGRSQLERYESDYIKLAEEERTALFNLAELYETAGQIDDAKKYYQQYIDSVDDPIDSLEEYERQLISEAKDKVGSL